MQKAREQVQRLLSEHLGEGAQVVHLREGSAVFRIGEDFEEGPGLFVVQMRVAHNGARAGEVTLIGRPEPLDFGGVERVETEPVRVASPVRQAARVESRVERSVRRAPVLGSFDPFDVRVAAEPDPRFEEDAAEEEEASMQEGSSPSAEEDPTASRTYAEEEAEHVRPSERERSREERSSSRERVRGKTRMTPPRRDDMHS